MAKFLNRYNIYFSIFLYLLLFIVTLNWYRYSFDSDGVSYLTIARRIARHEWVNSINSYWSPLNSWVASLFYNNEINEVLVFKIINACISVGIILLVHLLCKRFIKTGMLVTSVLLVLPVILLSYTHIQLAGDLLQLFFLLLYSLIITANGFFTSIRKNLLCGLVMALAYLAKYYSLPFFIVNHFCLFVLYYSINRKEKNIYTVIKPLAAAYTAFLFAVIPWLYCLYIKYDEWMYSSASALNFNWYLGNTESTLKNYGLLIPPPYPNSPSYGEDPYLYYQSFTGPFSSSANFFKFCILTLHNVKDALIALLDISFTSFAIVGWYVLKLIKSGKGKISQPFNLLIITALVLPCGYILIHFEERFIWLTAAIIFIGGCRLLEEKVYPWLSSNLSKISVTVVFLLSFLLHPADRLQDLRNSGKDLIAAKDFLKANSISGKFAAQYTQASQDAWLQEFAYVSGNQFYILSRQNYSQDEILKSITDNGIHFYFYYYSSAIDKENFLLGKIAKASRKIIPLPGQPLLIAVFQ